MPMCDEDMDRGVRPQRNVVVRSESWSFASNRVNITHCEFDHTGVGLERKWNPMAWSAVLDLSFGSMDDVEAVCHPMIKPSSGLTVKSHPDEREPLSIVNLLTREVSSLSKCLEFKSAAQMAAEAGCPFN
jgi:hypothetical protein